MQKEKKKLKSIKKITIVLILIALVFVVINVVGSHFEKEKLTKTHEYHINHRILELDDGRLLVVDYHIEIYDPDKDEFIYVGNLPDHVSHTEAVKLKDGTVFFTGHKAQYLRKAFIFDPKTLKIKDMGEIRFDYYESIYKMLLLPNGNVLMFNEHPLEDKVFAQIYNYKTKTFHKTDYKVPKLPIYSYIHTDDGKLLLIGSIEFHVKEGKFFTFSRKRGIWSYSYKTGDVDLLKKIKAIYLKHLKLSDNEYLLIFWRSNSEMNIAAKIYNVQTNELTPYDEFKVEGFNTSRRIVADPDRQKIYFVGNYFEKRTKRRIIKKLVRDLQIYDIKTKTLKVKKNVLIYPRGSHTATLLKNGKIIVIGGTNGKKSPKRKYYKQSQLIRINNTK